MNDTYSRERLPGNQQAKNRIFRSYKNDAKNKGVTFLLTEEQFFSLTSSNCKYCGIEPIQVFKPSHYYKGYDNDRVYFYNGIDRINPQIGYEIDNVVSCCSTCNYAKRTMSVDQFLNWIYRVYKKSLTTSDEKSIGFLIDELFTTDYKCWWEQEKIMDKSQTDEFRKDAAEKAQKLNARRNDLIRAIDNRLGEGNLSPTHKTYHTYFEKSADGNNTITKS